jgi:carbonic anhydrase
MDDLKPLLERNRAWAAEMTRRDPGFFARLARQQKPTYLWIGCSDSRVPATQIVDLLPGEMFVHRNVSNLVSHTDLNGLATIQYAVEFLGVRHVIVCGHYGCGGVIAALRDARHGLIDNWLRPIQDVHARHRAELDALATEELRQRRLCELNVLAQTENLARTTIVREVRARGNEVFLHSWIYDVRDGLLQDLAATATDGEAARSGATSEAGAGSAR